jgi:WD40 repeat protein
MCALRGGAQLTVCSAVKCGFHWGAGHNSDVDVVRWHPNAHYVATGSTDRTVRLWDVRDGATQRVLLGHQAAVCTAFHLYRIDVCYIHTRLAGTY